MKTLLKACSWRAFTVIGCFVLGYVLTGSTTQGVTFAFFDSAVRFLGQVMHDVIFDFLSKS